jgi:hypothetical protein
MRLIHNVYFALKDDSAAGIETLILACKKYLNSQAGIVYFAVGEVAAELTREVNVRDWHVSLHLVFDTPEHQEAYQGDKLHLQFIEENQANWAKVRVFDSLVHAD